MAKQSVNFKPRGFNFAAFPFVNATGTTIETLLAASANDSIIKAISITSDDTSNRAVQLYIFDGTTNFLFDTIAVATLAGVDGTVPAVNGLTTAGLPLEGAVQLKKVLPLKAGCTLKAAMAVAVTAAKTVTVNVIAEDY